MSGICQTIYIKSKKTFTQKGVRMKEPGYGMLNVAIDDLLPNMNRKSQYEIRMYFYGNMKKK